MRDPLAVFQLLVPNLSGKLATTNGGEYAGKCPFTQLGECSSREDAFRCWPYRENRPTLWFCRKCGRSGDLIELARYCIEPGRYAGYHEACDWLEISEEERRLPVAYKVYRSRNVETPAPPPAWQEKAALLIHKSMDALWSTQYGEFALEYLHSRGLPDSVIRYARVGVTPEDRYYPVTEWGLTEERPGQKLKVPAGILFPCLFNDDCEIWSLVVRRSDEDAELDPTGNTDPYWMIRGSGEGLYLAHTLSKKNPAIMVESYIDALSILAMCQDDPDLHDYPLGVCAARSSMRNKRVKWWRKLATVSGMLQSFDADNAGEIGAEYWISALSDVGCMRWSPGKLGVKDVNEALQQDPASVVSWLKEGIRQLLKNDSLFRQTQTNVEQAIVSQNAPVDQQHDQETGHAIPSYMCNYQDCRSLLVPYMHTQHGYWCIEHVWEDPSLQGIPRHFVTHENHITAQLCTFLLTFLAEDSLRAHALCFACEQPGTQMDVYGRLWCEVHRFPGCTVIGTMPKCAEEFADEAFFEEQDYDHCHLCGEPDDSITPLLLCDHEQVWCTKHAPYKGYGLTQIFPWLFEQVKQIQAERDILNMTIVQCVHNDCCFEGTHEDILGDSWCDAHSFSCDLINEGSELKWQQLWVPPGESYGKNQQGDVIEGGRVRWLEYAKTASREAVMLAHRFAWEVMRGAKNDPSVHYPCVRRDSAGCHNPTNTRKSVQDISGRCWCQECAFCAALLEEGEEQGYPPVLGSHRWKPPGEMIPLEGEAEYLYWALYQPVREVKLALVGLRQQLAAAAKSVVM